MDGLRYAVIENTPGYLPERMEEPADFDTRDEAIRYAEALADELREHGHHVRRVGDRWFAERSRRDLGRVVEIAEVAS